MRATDDCRECVAGLRLMTAVVSTDCVRSVYPSLPGEARDTPCRFSSRPEHSFVDHRRPQSAETLGWVGRGRLVVVRCLVRVKSHGSPGHHPDDTVVDRTKYGSIMMQPQISKSLQLLFCVIDFVGQGLTITVAAGANQRTLSCGQQRDHVNPLSVTSSRDPSSPD